MTRCVSILTLVMGLAFGRPALSQAGAPLPGMMPEGALLPPELGSCCDGFRVGHWVEYLVASPMRRQVWHLHLAVVGREGSAYWLELTVAQARGGEAITRMLVEPSAGEEGRRLLRLIVQPEGQLPLELPVDQARSPLPEGAAGEGPGVLVGQEAARVTAGTFQARHYRRGQGDNARDVWLSERVPLWGLVRFESSQVRLTLVALGTGAVSRVVAEPIPFDPSTLR